MHIQPAQKQPLFGKLTPMQEQDLLHIESYLKAAEPETDQFVMTTLDAAEAAEAAGKRDWQVDIIVTPLDAHLEQLAQNGKPILGILRSATDKIRDLANFTPHSFHWNNWMKLIEDNWVTERDAVNERLLKLSQEHPFG